MSVGSVQRFVKCLECKCIKVTEENSQVRETIKIRDLREQGESAFKRENKNEMLVNELKIKNESKHFGGLEKQN